MSIIPDQPITKIEEDRFGRGEFAKRVAGVISSLEDKSSIVVSINAPWGEGKSSILSMIEEELSRDGKALVIRFNPWRFSDEDQLLRKYFIVLSAKLGKSLSKGKELAKVLKAYAEAITPLAEMTIPIGGKILGETLKSLVTRRVETPAPDLEELKGEIEKYLLADPRRIVIFMDDIDRLNKLEIQAVFRLVKLTADFSNTAYILAFDNEKVAASLAEQFGNEEAGRSFLEKIVQVPLPVPPADPRVLMRIVFEGIESALNSVEVNLTTKEIRRFFTVFDKSFSRMPSSPREVKRYINMLNFALPILKGEANMLDLILIEGVRAFYPKVYEMVRDEFGAFLEDSFEYASSTDKASVKNRFGNLLTKSVEGLTEEEVYGVQLALQVLFPHIQEYGINAAKTYAKSDSEDWTTEKRICASRYFRRYFNYGIPPSEIGDKEVERFINSLSGADVEQLMNELEILCDGGRAETLIHKLITYEYEIKPNDAGKLAIAIARRSDLIPETHPSDKIMKFGILTRTSILLGSLISSIEDAAVREDIAKDVAKGIERLPFLDEFEIRISTFYIVDEQAPDKKVRTVSDECVKEIERIFVEKLLRAAETETGMLEDLHPQLKRTFYFKWSWHNLESLRQYAHRRLEEHPEDVAKFLSEITRISNDEKSKYDYISTANPDESFNLLADILAPDKWMKIIRQSYPKAKEDYDLPRAVRWFAQMYERRRKESEVFARLSFTSDADRKTAFSVWQLLTTESKPMTLEDIGSKLNLNSYAVSQILYALIQNDFVKENPDEGDGKRYSATSF